jgi:predicted RNA-binding Zn-ribbon protein involved in translation (DUF1610 family)
MTDPLLSRLQRDIAELCDAYDEGASRGPGLLHQLEEVEGRTLASVERSEGKAGKPGSKPPMPLDAVDLAMKIKRGAQDWCHTLGAEHLLDGYESLRRLPDLCARASNDMMHDLCSDVGRWRSTARTVLGYQQAAQHYKEATCPYCGQQNIWARSEQVRAWCATPECEDPDTGQQPQFTRISLLTLIQEAS